MIAGGLAKSSLGIWAGNRTKQQKSCESYRNLSQRYSQFVAGSYSVPASVPRLLMHFDGRRKRGFTPVVPAQRGGAKIA
jgi:hypothetical protein